MSGFKILPFWLVQFLAVLSGLTVLLGVLFVLFLSLINLGFILEGRQALWLGPLGWSLVLGTWLVLAIGFGVVLHAIISDQARLSFIAKVSVGSVAILALLMATFGARFGWPWNDLTAVLGYAGTTLLICFFCRIWLEAV